ncbi:LOW QUALITY PROTEIN: uncharacterized protein [Eurosta solidaginis]|uniref:LOW QUALITY PROTEIN: uncharacterized protein n=1 Tax=Eurosta solidaginis TaxID=178769 RepID=UPI0035314733
MKQSGSSPGLSSYFERDLYGPNTYAFGFEVNDNRTGNVQFRDERRYVNGSVEGSFGYVRPDGRVIVTAFLSDSERGFLHDTRTFEVGDQQWKAHWPTKGPNVPHMPDKDLHLNVTNNEIPADKASSIKNHYGVDLNANENNSTDVGYIVVQDIIDGKVPLQTVPGKTETHVGFVAVNDFLPPNFPIVAFKLPPIMANETAIGVAEQRPATGKQTNNNNKKQSKYNEVKVNNAEKSLSIDMLVKSNTSASQAAKPEVDDVINKSKQNTADQPLPLTETSKDAAKSNGAWHAQLIDETRNDFLNKLPDLN